MEIGLYLRNIDTINEIPEDIMHKADSITCGDHGCTYVLPTVDELLALKHSLLNQNKGLHYISPKLSQSHLDDELNRVVTLLREGLSISINDWGLLYKLKDYIKPEYDICIGRLLSKSIADWAWGALLLGGEKDRGKQYLMQNSFNHKLKIDYFKNLGIKGIDVSAHPDSEASYIGISNKGLYVTGFADSTYLAVSRACPVIHIENLGRCSDRCREFCTREEYHLIPVKADQQRMYPKMQLIGNTVYKPIDVKPRQDAYRRILYTWNSLNADKIKNIFN